MRFRCPSGRALRRTLPCCRLAIRHSIHVVAGEHTNSVDARSFELVNLTPHPVTILTPSGPFIIRAGSTPARLRTELIEPRVIRCEGFDITLLREVPTAPVGIPQTDQSSPHRLFIVSRVVADRYWWRSDLVFPSQFDRDLLTGKVVACSSLSRLWDRGHDEDDLHSHSR